MNGSQRVHGDEDEVAAVYAAMATAKTDTQIRTRCFTATETIG